MRLLSSVLVLSALAIHPYVLAETNDGQLTDDVPKSVSAKKYAVDLMALYRESRLEDPRILASNARAEASKERAREAFGAMLPQISANAGRNRTKQSTELTEQMYNSSRYSISLSQVLYNKAVWERYQQQKLNIEQAQSDTIDAKAEVTVDLAERYFAALAADDELELIQAELRATQKNLDRINALYEKKYAMVTDLLDLKARVDALIAQEVEIRNRVRLSRAALSEIVGRPVTENLSRIRTDVDFHVSDRSLEDWVQEALENNPALKSSKIAVEVAQAAIREGKGGHYPTLSLQLSAQNTDEGYNNSLSPKTDSYVAGVQLSVPIYSGGSTSARVRGLTQDQIAAEQRLESIKRQVVKETTDAYLTAYSSVERIRATQNALLSAKQSSIASEKAFSYGVINAVDVLTATENEFKARRDLLRAQYDFITNLFILNRWAGKLSDESVENVNIWLSQNSANN